MQEQNNHKYDDIIHLEHPVSKTHPQMSLYDRAAQFAPFAALTGHAAAIRETARRTDEKRVLSDEVLEELNEKLNIISANIGTEQLVDIPISYRMRERPEENMLRIPVSLSESICTGER